MAPPEYLKLSEDEAIAVARSLIVKRLAAYDAVTAREREAPTPSALSELQTELSGEIGDLLDPENDEGDRQVQSAARRALLELGYDLPERPQLDKRILDLVRRALVAANRIEVARLANDFRDNPRDVLFSNLRPSDELQMAKVHRAPETVASAMEKFWGRVISVEPKAPKTAAKCAAYSAVVVRFFGPNTPMLSITRDKCHEFRDLVARLPPNYLKSKDAPAPDAPLGAIVAYADRKGSQRIAYATQELYLARMSTFFNWARRERITPDLDVSDIRPRGKPPEKHTLRSSFDAKQLTAIFSAPIYSECKDDQRGFRTPGPGYSSAAGTGSHFLDFAQACVRAKFVDFELQTSSLVPGKWHSSISQ